MVATKILTETKAKRITKELQKKNIKNDYLFITRMQMESESFAKRIFLQRQYRKFFIQNSLYI